MPKVKAKEKVEKAPLMYKGYDVRWLRSEPAHPDYKLIAEYDNKYKVK